MIAVQRVRLPFGQGTARRLGSACCLADGYACREVYIADSEATICAP